MDNNVFETEMINHVNSHATDAKHNRMVAESAAMERKEHNRKLNAFRAVLELILMVMLLVTITYAMWALNWLCKVSAVLAVSMTAVFSCAIGMRINALARTIKKGMKR